MDVNLFAIEGAVTPDYDHIIISAIAELKEMK